MNDMKLLYHMNSFDRHTHTHRGIRNWMLLLNSQKWTKYFFFFFFYVLIEDINFHLVHISWLDVYLLYWGFACAMMHVWWITHKYSVSIIIMMCYFQMVPATVVTTTIAGSTPTVVIANPANAHLSLPIGKMHSALWVSFTFIFVLL